MTRSKSAKRPPVASGTNKASTQPAADKRTDGLRTGSKLALMLDLALRPEGVTEPELLAALGWKSCRVTLRRACDRAGAELTMSRRSAEAGRLFHDARFTLHGIVIVRGSSTRPSTVSATFNPQSLHVISYTPQRGAGYGRLLQQRSLSPGIDPRGISISRPFGYFGSGLHCGSRPESKNTTSIVMFGFPSA